MHKLLRSTWQCSSRAFTITTQANADGSIRRMMTSRTNIIER